jgi:prepilin-type N-terminal cleavage/methylation domain-containing protein
VASSGIACLAVIHGRDMKRYSHGFTLLEMLLVLTIIGAVTAIAMPRVKNGMVSESVRAARRAVVTHLSRARAVASSRGCRAVVHVVAGASARVWVTTCGPAGTGVDTLGAVEEVGSKFKVTVVSSVDSITYAPNGLAIGAGWAGLRFSRSSHVDTLSVSPLGKAVW